MAIGVLGSYKESRSGCTVRILGQLKEEIYHCVFQGKGDNEIEEKPQNG